MCTLGHPKYDTSLFVIPAYVLWKRGTITNGGYDYSWIISGGKKSMTIRGSDDSCASCDNWAVDYEIDLAKGVEVATGHVNRILEIRSCGIE